ncbi:hypothetical protein O3P69_014795 [Scylla paramamosain]|uniref:Cuticle protein n=1 Tax=Scylla paramamosain TaxID=85552 RepID=A0AAW0TYS7_SCYPA
MAYKILVVCVAAAVALARPEGPAQLYGVPGSVHPCAPVPMPSHLSTHVLTPQYPYPHTTSTHALTPPRYPNPHTLASQDTAPSYNFDYAVKDYQGNDFGHQESRDGYDTQGSYYVQLPDTRLQEVKYTVSGDSGFLADVTYQGEAQYPAYNPAHKPATSYQPVTGYA